MNPPGIERTLGFRDTLGSLPVLVSTLFQHQQSVCFAKRGQRVGVTMTLLGSQMPFHLISDAHEWINKIPTVPVYHLAKPQPSERAWENQRGRKTLLSLTLI